MNRAMGLALSVFALGCVGCKHTVELSYLRMDNIPYPMPTQEKVKAHFYIDGKDGEQQVDFDIDLKKDNPYTNISKQIEPHADGYTIRVVVEKFAGYSSQRDLPLLMKIKEDDKPTTIITVKSWSPFPQIRYIDGVKDTDPTNPNAEPHKWSGQLRVVVRSHL